MRKFFTVILLVLSFMIVPSLAQAGTYTFTPCTGLPGATLRDGDGGWTLYGAGAQWGYESMFHGNYSCLTSGNGSFAANLYSPNEIPVWGGTGWGIKAPPNTRITRFSAGVTGAGKDLGGEGDIGTINHIYGINQQTQAWQWDNGQIYGTANDTPFSFDTGFNISETYILSMIGCHSYGNSCPAVWRYQGEDSYHIGIHYPLPYFTDDYAPSGSVNSGATNQAKINGNTYFNVNSSDAGSGVYKTRLLVDGVERSAYWGQWQKYSCHSSINPGETFGNPVPCPLNISNQSLNFNTKTVGDGSHRFTIDVVDASGNYTTLYDRYQTVVNNVPTINTNPSISGSPIVGSTLTLTPTVWNSVDTVTRQIEWQRCGIAPASTTCVSVPGATGLTYTLSHDDEGKQIRVVEYGSNYAGYAIPPAYTTRWPATGAGGGGTPVINEKPNNQTTPTISGTTHEEQTLTADKGTWWGTSPLTYSYQWYACQDSAGANCAAVQNATQSTYTLTNNDINKFFKVAVTGTNPYGNQTVNSATTSKILEKVRNTTIPVINSSSPALVGQTVTSSAGSWTGSQTITYTYQWKRCDQTGNNCQDISGATGSSYTLTHDDAETTLISSVKAANAVNNVTVNSNMSTVIHEAPKAVVAPSIDGFAHETKVLTANEGQWWGTPDLVFFYRWQRCDSNGNNCAAISGANSKSYVVSQADAGNKLRFQVIATNDYGVTTAYSSQTTAILESVRNITPPNVSGVTITRETLSTDNGSFTGSPTISYSYQWQKCDENGNNCQDISGATSSTYLLKDADAGFRIRSLITASNEVNSVTTPSALTVPIAEIPHNRTAPSIQGQAHEDTMLVADKGAWTATEPVTYSYQWQSCDQNGGNCQNILLANTSTYTLNNNDVGKTIRVKVTASNAFGTGEEYSQTTSPVLEKVRNQTKPSITGVLITENTLTADKGTWIGHAPITYDYQWQRCNTLTSLCNDINGATSSSYTLTDNDHLSSIRIKITASNTVNSITEYSTQTTTINKTPHYDSPTPATIEGQPHESKTLTINKGTWTGSETITYTYQWQTCDENETNCQNIQGATNQTYQPTQNNVDKQLRAQITATNDYGQKTITTLPTNKILEKLRNTTLPTTSNQKLVGQTLTSTNGTWTGNNPITYTYQWQRCPRQENTNCQNIPGATNDTYTLQTEDDLHQIQLITTAHNTVGELTATTEKTELIKEELTNITPPTIQGDMNKGSAIKIDNGTWKGTKPVTFTYQWQRCDKTNNCTTIENDSQEYKLTNEDFNMTIQAVITATNPVNNIKITTTQTPTITALPAYHGTLNPPTGEPKTGNTLKAPSDETNWENTETINYEWYRCDNTQNCVKTGTDNTYILTEEDKNKQIKLQIIGINQHGQTRIQTAQTETIEDKNQQTINLPNFGKVIIPQKLVADTSMFPPGSTFEFQWQKCTNTGCLNIDGETKQEYYLKDSDVGTVIKVNITAYGPDKTPYTASQSTDPIMAKTEISSENTPACANLQLYKSQITEGQTPYIVRLVARENHVSSYISYQNKQQKVKGTLTIKGKKYDIRKGISTISYDDITEKTNEITYQTDGNKFKLILPKTSCQKQAVRIVKMLNHENHKIFIFGVMQDKQIEWNFVGLKNLKVDKISLQNKKGQTKQTSYAVGTKSITHIPETEEGKLKIYLTKNKQKLVKTTIWKMSTLK